MRIAYPVPIKYHAEESIPNVTLLPSTLTEKYKSVGKEGTEYFELVMRPDAGGVSSKLNCWSVLAASQIAVTSCPAPAPAPDAERQDTINNNA